MKYIEYQRILSAFSVAKNNLVRYINTLTTNPEQ